MNVNAFNRKIKIKYIKSELYFFNKLQLEVNLMMLKMP